MPVMSFIVPVYNAQGAVGRCINSILNQTFRDLELIIVNDGSTDNSLEICHRYQALDDRIKIINIPNGGVSNARNTGIKAASGDYIQFLDSDDTIDPQKTEKLLDAMKKYDADLSICGIKVIQNNKLTAINTIATFATESVIARGNFLENLPEILLMTGLLEGINTKLYKKNIIDKNNIIYPTSTSYGEDLLFNLEYYRWLERTVFIAYPYYNYFRDNSDSLSSKYIDGFFDNQTMLVKKIRDMLATEGFWTEKSEGFLATYFTSHIFASLDMLFHANAPLSEHARIGEIARIINDDIVRDYLPKSLFIHDGDKFLADRIMRFDVFSIVDLMKERLRLRKEDSRKPVDDNDQKVLLTLLEQCRCPSYRYYEKQLFPNTGKPSLANRMLRGCLRIVCKILPNNNRIAQNAAKVEENLKLYGISYTLRRIRKRVGKK